MSQPFVSIVMPIRNEADFIAQSLGAVLAQDYPHHLLEVLITDGQSTDSTRAVVATLLSQTDIPGQVIDNPRKIVPTGLNLAIRAARGEIVVRVDGHCVIAPDYVSRCVDWLMKSDPDVACVGGAIETIGETPVSQGIAYAMSSRFGVGGSTFRVGANEPTLVDTVPFPAFRKSALTRAGDFDEDLVRNQDDEYSYRLRGLGYRILLIPEIRSTYYSRGSLRRLWSQYYQYGYWKVRVMHKHPRQMSPRQLIPPLFVLGVIGGALISLFTPVIFMMYLLVLALYGVLNLAVSVTLARQHGTHYLRVLPPAFLILHLSYGIGFWVGIIAWARKRL